MKFDTGNKTTGEWIEQEELGEERSLQPWGGADRSSKGSETYQRSDILNMESEAGPIKERLDYLIERS